MLKKYLLAGILAVLSMSTSMAQVKLNKSVTCGKVPDVVKNLSDYYGEVLIWLASGENGLNNFAMFLNNQTRTWSLVQIHESLACILGSGQGINVIDAKREPIL